MPSPRRTLRAQLIQLHVAFKNDFGIRGNFQIYGFAFHQLDRLLAEEAGDDELFNIRGGRHDG